MSHDYLLARINSSRMSFRLRGSRLSTVVLQAFLLCSSATASLEGMLVENVPIVPDMSVLTKVREQEEQQSRKLGSSEEPTFGVEPAPSPESEDCSCPEGEVAMKMLSNRRLEEKPEENSADTSPSGNVSIAPEVTIVMYDSEWDEQLPRELLWTCQCVPDNSTTNVPVPTPSPTPTPMPEPMPVPSIDLTSTAPTPTPTPTPAPATTTSTNTSTSTTTTSSTTTTENAATASTTAPIKSTSTTSTTTTRTTTTYYGDCASPIVAGIGDFNVCAEGKSIFPEFEKCTPRCPEGFTVSLDGSQSNLHGNPQCISRQWDATLSCEPGCPDQVLNILTADTGAVLSTQSCPQTLHGEACETQCPDGYIKKQDFACYRGAFGVGTCSERRCDTAPPRLNNTLPSWSPERCRGLSSGDDCPIVCDIGFRAQSSGEWADSPSFTCDKGEFFNAHGYDCRWYTGDALVPVQSPRIVSVAFADTFTNIEVVFSGPVRFCPSFGSEVTTNGSCKQEGVTVACEGLCARNTGSGQCSDFLDKVSSSSLLGFNPTCSLSGDRLTFTIALGETPTIRIGEKFRFRNETVFSGALPPGADDNTHYLYSALSGDGLFAEVEIDPTATQSLGVSLVGPTSVQECGSLLFKASSARGAEGRPFVYSWTVGPSTSTLLRIPMWAKLSKEVGSVVSIDSNEWGEILADAKTRGELSGQNLSLEVVVDVLNWRGLSEEATAQVMVTLEAAPKPVIEYVSLPHISINRLEDATFAVKTSGVLKNSCGSSANSQDSDTSAWSVVLQWSISVDGSQTFTPISNLLAEAPIFVDGNSFNVGDIAHDPNVLTVPAFEGGALRFRDVSSSRFSNFVILATASYASQNGSAIQLLKDSGASLSFTMEVSDVPPPNVVMSGPEIVGEGCAFSIIAEVDTLNRYDTTDDVPTINWHVELNNVVIFQKNQSESVQLSPGKYTSELTSQSFDALAAGNYKFVVSGERRLNELSGWTQGSFSETYLLRVVDTQIPPPITITAPYVQDQRLSMKTQPGFVVVGKQAFGACTYILDGWYYYWVIAQDDTSGSIVVTYKATIRTSGDSNSYEVSEFPFEQFVGETKYKYALVYSDAVDAASSVMGHSDLISLEADGFYVQVAPRFLADAPPSSGTVQVSPVKGTALRDTFALTALNWIDDTPGRLEYEFYQFPIPESHALYSDMQCDLVTSTCATNYTTWQEDGDDAGFPINWDDPSSDNYWTNLGGALLRGFSSADVFEDVRFSPGKWLIAVRARDILDGVSSSKVLGCEVQKAVSYSSQELADVFDQAEMTGNADAQLNAIMSVTSSVTGNDTEASEVIKTKTLSALSAAAKNHEPGDKVLAKIGTAMESVTKQDLSVEEATSVASSLVTSLDKAEEIQEDAAVSFVRSIKVMHLQMQAKPKTTLASNSTGANATANTSAADQVEQEAKAEFTSQILSSTNVIGKSLVTNTKVGTVTEMITSANGSAGVDVIVARDSEAAFRSGSCFKNLTGVRATNCSHTYDAAVAYAGRRLSAERRLSSCDGSAGLHQTVWVQSNPHYLSDTGQYYVPTEASVRTVQIVACDTSVDISIDFPMEVDLIVPPDATGHSIKCVRYVRGVWTIDGLDLRNPSDAYNPVSGSSVSCNVWKLAGVVEYALAFDVSAVTQPIPQSSIFRLCPSIYLPTRRQNISWKCARQNFTSRSAFQVPGTYVAEGSTCIPLCPDRLVVNPMTVLAHCVSKGWTMYDVSEMYCAGWWEEDEKYAGAHTSRLPWVALVASLLALFTSAQ